MNGRELLEAMSFIDEDLVNASQTPARKLPVRRLAALAACLCLAVLGTLAISWLGPMKSAQTADTAMMEAARDEEVFAAPEALMDAGNGAPAAQDSAGSSAGAHTDEQEWGEGPVILAQVEKASAEALTVTVLEAGDLAGALEEGMVLSVTGEDLSFPSLPQAGDQVLLWVEHFDPDTQTLHILDLKPAQ